MTPEQLLLLANEFCAQRGATVTDYAALCAAASASVAKVEGIPVHASRRQAARALRKVLDNVPALSAHNREFAEFCELVFLRFSAEI